MSDTVDFEQEQIKQAKSIIYKLLARREYSWQELYHKLEQKDFSEFVIKQILSEFEANNQQSDYRVAEMLLSHGYKSGWGPNKIKQNMQSKGIAHSLIEEVFANINYPAGSHHTGVDNSNSNSNELFSGISKQQQIDKLKGLISESKDTSTNSVLANNDFSFIDWHQLVLQVAEKKFGRELASLKNKVNNNWQFKAKIQRFLYNKGFEQDHINYVINYFS